MFSKKCVLSFLGLLAALWIAGCGGSAKPSVSVTAAASTVDGADTTTITATVTNDHNGKGVTFTVSGGGSLSGQTTTTATFTAPAATSSSQTITITATSVADASQSGTVKITVPAAPAITTTGAQLASQVGATYAVTLAVSGGVSPYTWSVGTGSLPACLTFNASTGAIAGTITAACAGSYTPTFTVTDSGSPTKLTASTQLTMVLAAAPTITFGAAPTGTGTFNVAYASAVTASGGSGSLTYSLASGSLPPDLTLASSGAITGTPKAADVGTWNYAVTATDAFGDSTTSTSYSLVISYPQLTVSTSSLPSGYGNTAYSQTLAATGGNGGPYTWSVTSGASSLTTLNLSLSSAGVLSGTAPLAGGTATFTVKAADSANNSGTQNFTLTIKAGLSITTASPLAGGFGSTAYAQTLAASGGSGSGYTWSVTSGASSLAALNLSLSAAGVLSGTPPVAGGAANFSAQVKDSANNTATATYSLTIAAGLTVNAPTLSAAYPGQAYTSSAFTATGGSGAGYTWAMTAASGSSVPTGFAIGSTTGIISAASPVNASSTNATYNVVVTATDSLGNHGSANATITILGTVTITTGTSLNATVGVAYSQTLAAAGGVGPYTWQQISSTLSTVGLSFNGGTGVISGASPTAGSGTLTVTATDSQSHVSAQVTFTVTVSNQLVINQTTLPPGNVGSSYSQTLTAAGGSGTGYTFSATNSNLSTYGLSLAASGAITGTPTSSGTASFTANVKDSANNTATQALTIQVYSALSLPAPNPSSLPSTGLTGQSYSGSITGSGGSGSYSWIAAGLTGTGLSATPSGATLNVSGSPLAVGTITLGVTLKDTTTNNSITQNYTITVSNPTPVSLPAPNPSSLPAATVSQSYSGTITASGGVAPYTWTVNGAATTGSGASLGNGTLVATSTGGSSLTISGTPSTTGTVNLTNVKVVDSTSPANTNATQSYTITVNANGSQITGQVNWAPICGTAPSLPTFSVSINTTPVQTVSTDSSGNFTLTGVANGSYVITPSYSGPTGSSSVFYPGTQSVTVNNGNLTNENFQVALGYTVSGTVNYSGTHTGRIYVDLLDSNCSSDGGSGTSISAAGTYTIHGVQPGSYTLQAWMDVNDSTADGYNLGQGVPNSSDPTGSLTTTVGTSVVTGANVTLADNNPTSAPTTPSVNAVFPSHDGVVISFKPATGTTGNTEVATSYDVAWSTSPSLSSGALASVAGTMNFKAIGRGTTIWILNNQVTGASSFTDGTAYYFQTRANNAAGHSAWTVYGGATPTSVTVGPPSGANSISGTVTIPSGVTVGAHAVLYVGFYSNTAGIYGTMVTSPAVGSNAYTVSVPSGTWQNYAILDQNNDGLVDAGDVSNVHNSGPPTVTISGGGTQNLTLSAANFTPVVQTRYQQTISSGGTSTGYGLNMGGGAGVKLPVSVQLTAASNPNVIVPTDVSGYCPDCGSIQFQFYQNIGGSTPNVSDTYTFTVTYSDGTQDTNVIAAVTGWNGGATVVGSSDLPSGLSPSGTGSTSTTPTFTWTDAAAATSTNDLYSFYIYQTTGCSGNCTLWQIPGNNSNSTGFSSSITSITWGTDPTGGGSTPTVGSLTIGTVYNWTITVQDANGNQAQTQNWYQP